MESEKVLARDETRNGTTKIRNLRYGLIEMSDGRFCIGNKKHGNYVHVEDYDALAAELAEAKAVVALFIVDDQRPLSVDRYESLMARARAIAEGKT